MNIKIQNNECWWGIATTIGIDVPLSKENEGFSRDLNIENYSNQAAPLLVSNQGRYIWCDKAFVCTIKEGELIIEAQAPIDVVQAGSTLREAFLAA